MRPFQVCGARRNAGRIALKRHMSLAHVGIAKERLKAHPCAQPARIPAIQRHNFRRLVVMHEIQHRAVCAAQIFGATANIGAQFFHRFQFQQFVADLLQRHRDKILLLIGALFGAQVKHFVAQGLGRAEGVAFAGG